MSTRSFRSTKSKQQATSNKQQARMTLFYSISLEDFKSIYDALEGNSLEKLLVLLDGFQKYKQNGENQPLCAIMGRTNTVPNDRRQSENVTASTIYFDSKYSYCGDRPEPEAKHQYTMYTVFIEDIMDCLGKIPSCIFDSIIFDHCTAYFCGRTNIKDFCDRFLKEGGRMVFDYITNQSSVVLFRVVNGVTRFFNFQGKSVPDEVISDYFDLDTDLGTLTIKEVKTFKFLSECSTGLCPGANITLLDITNGFDNAKIIRADIGDSYKQWLPYFFEGYDVQWSKYSFADDSYPLSQARFEDTGHGHVKKNVRVWPSTVNPNPELEFFFNEAMTGNERSEYFMTKFVSEDKMTEVVERIRDTEDLLNKFNSCEEIKESFDYDETYLKILCQLHHDYPVVTIVKR